MIDFLNPALTYKRLHGGGLALPVAKACGVRGAVRPKIIDATAGLGEDGFLLASLGCEVQMIERNPVIASALREALALGLENLEIQAIISRIILFHGSALDLIPQLTQDGPIDVIYLDPMFPHRKKSALVKKDMRDLRDIVGDDLDADNLLEVARQHAKRIVVKRPKGAGFLAGVVTKDQIKGERGRFDIYSGLINRVCTERMQTRR